MLTLGRRPRRGFTLVELMVSLALGLIVLGALSALFLRNTSSQSELDRGVQQAENARFSLDTLAEDIMHAGYYSDFDPNSLSPAPAYQLGDSCPTAVTGLGWDTSASPVQVPFPLVGLASGGTLTCATNRMASTEALVLRHADTGNSINLASAVAGNLYLQIPRCTNVVIDPLRIIASSTLTAAAFPGRLPDCTTRNDALRRFVQRLYYIATCSDCSGSGDGIPTLRRVEWIDGALRNMVVAEGVENLQIEYGLDTTGGDGVVDQFLTRAGVTGVAPLTWDNVIAVRLHMLTRATEPTNGFVETKTYRLGPDVTINPASLTDGFKRTLFTTTMRLQNVGGRRER